MKKFTPDMNDEEFDQLFRDAAGNYQPEWKGDSWEKIANRLDEADASSGRRRFIIPWWQAAAAAIGIVAAGSILIYHTSLFHKKMISTVAPVSDKIKPANTPGKNDTAETLQLNITSAKSSVQKNIADTPVAISQPVMHTATQNNQVAAPAISSNNPALQPVNKKEKNNHTGNTPDNNFVEQQNMMPASDQGNNNIQRNNAPVDLSYTLDHKLAALSFTPVLSAIPLPAYYAQNVKGISAKPDNASTNEPVKLHKKSFQPALNHVFSLQFVAGPDWNTVRFTGWGKVGSTGGILLQYHFAKRWSVESGVIFSEDMYSSGPQNYNPKYPLRDRDDIEKINAECNITDMPVNIRFDVLDNYFNKIFLSAGLSSYWMNKEQYYYTYKRFRWGQRWYDDIYDANKHILSVFNFSAGYEQNLSNHISLQAAPFLKLPLTGIGFGRVKMSSTGVYFSLKYNF